MVSQSGALGMALAQAVVRGVSFSHVLTSGNSCDVDMADYISYLADDPSCAAIACVFEGMAEPERMLIAAERAWQRDKPLIVFKMATGEQGAAAAMSHTGSLAGSQAAYRAVFRRAGAILVDDFEALCGDRGVLRQGADRRRRAASRWLRRRAARRSWRPIARSSSACRCRSRRTAVREVLLAHIPEFGSARNPCDVTAQILANPESLNACADALLAIAAYGALVVPQTYGYAPSAKRIPVYDSLAAKHGKIACIAWQTEWLEGPGVKEAEECGPRGAVPLDAVRVSRRWRRGIGERTKRAAAAPAAASTPADTVQQASATDRCCRRPHADRTRGEGGAGAVRRAGGGRTRRAE